MKIVRVSPFVSTFALATVLSAQDAPPSALASVETERTRFCVPALARIAALDREMEPIFRRGERIQLLNAAITTEDSMRVAPFDDGNPLEVAVREWFARDHALALQYLDNPDESIQDRRTEAREAMRQQLREAMEPLADEADARIAAAGDLDEAVDRCEGAILVRATVLEVCQTETSPVCDAARASEPDRRYALVDEAADLWSVDELRAWSEPLPLHVTPEGSLAGASTATLARKGNLLLSMGLEPMVRPRSSVTPEQAAEFDTYLDSLGIPFADRRYVMAPALTLQFNVTAPLGGETHYLLHFGDLSDPARDVIWTAPTPGGVPFQAMVPAQPWVLAGLARGEPVSLTAVRMAAAGNEVEAVYTLEVTQFGQARSISGLLSYLASGQFGQDMLRLVPEGAPDAVPPGSPPPGSGAR